MLTKDLIRASVRKGKLYPQLQSHGDDELKKHLSSCQAFLQTQIGNPIGEVKEELEQRFGSLHLSMPGFIKLALDRCQFVEDGQNAVQQRWDFMHHAQAAREAALGYQDFQEALSASLDMDFDSIKSQLYSDLPEFKSLSEVPFFDIEEWISRYNAAQIQGHLLKAKSVELSFTELSLIQKRSLSRTLKFHGLVADVDEQKEGSLTIKVDGPLSIFEGGGIYGTKLANFFPRILEFPKWKLTAVVDYKRKVCDLAVSSNPELKSYLKQSSGYVPLELEIFLEGLNKKKGEWVAKASEKALNLGAQNYCFPDFELNNAKSKKSVSVEVFHKWHIGQLKKRLAGLDAVRKKGLVLAVPSQFKKKKEFIGLFESAGEIEDLVVFYKDFPTPTAVLKLLKSRN